MANITQTNIKNFPTQIEIAFKSCISHFCFLKLICWHSIIRKIQDVIVFKDIILHTNITPYNITEMSYSAFYHLTPFYHSFVHLL